MTTKSLLWVWAAAIALTLTIASCGGSDSPSTSPSPSPSPSPTPTPSPTPSPTPTPTPTPSPGGGTTITITASGASPRTLTVAAGTRVTFVNNDSRAHTMNSNPHPEHTDCPELNQVGFLAVGQTLLTGNLNTRRTCGYHDHALPDNTSLQGSITIQ